MIATPAESPGRRNPGGGNGKRNRRPGPREGTGQAITGADVRAALAGLAAEHRQVIVEIYYHNRSVRETADLLRVPVSTVASRAYTAVRHLPRALTAARELARPALCRANPLNAPPLPRTPCAASATSGAASQLVRTAGGENGAVTMNPKLVVPPPAVTDAVRPGRPAARAGRS